MSSKKQSVESKVKEIKRRTRKKYSSEEKIRIVLEGLRGEESIAKLCRKEGINSNIYYKWSKDFLEAGKKRSSGDIKREATTSEVHNLKNENLKQLVVAELSLEVSMVKNNLTVPSVSRKVFTCLTSGGSLVRIQYRPQFRMKELDCKDLTLFFIGLKWG